LKANRPTRFDVLVCYDVNTTDSAGRKRLRKVAKACEGYGQRVQNSVFECTLSEALLEKLRAKLVDIIHREQDSLRIYFLYGGRETRLEVYGRDTWTDMSGPLIA
jgi:CRISPR-associated protein Cas2